MTVLETLENCRSLVIECQQISRLIEAVILPGARGCASPRIGGVPSGSQSAGERLDTYEKWLLKDQAESAMLVAEVERMAETLPQRQAKVINWYYCEAMIDAGIAARLGLARSTITERRDAAILVLQDRFNGRKE
jgi:DNA-directed RNA polymerase specialized sigma24 family protein